MEIKTEQDAKLVHPPWQLCGEGHVFLFRTPTTWAKSNAFLADYQRKALRVGVGAMMLVDYQASAVGPYYELLFIPALFNIKGRYTFSISKIYVSSEASVVNGKHHWGIPKELAHFTRTITDPNREEWEVSLPDGTVFFSVKLEKTRLRIPISTGLFPLSIVQQQTMGYTLTRPSASGKAGRVKATDWSIRSDYFPNVAELSLLLSTHISSLSMVFPLGTAL